MQRTYHYAIFITLFLGMVSLGGQALAITVKNLTDQPHQVAIGSYGDREEVVEIAPYGIYRTFSPHLRVRLLTGAKPNRSALTGRFRDEFAIWPDGTFGIQKRRWPQHPRR